MHWSSAFATAVAWGVFGQTSTSAFQTPFPQQARNNNRIRTGTSSKTTSLFVGGLGWDNENFLESLNKGQSEIEKANQDYYRHARFGKEGPPPDAYRPGGADDDVVPSPPPPPPPVGKDELPSDGIQGAVLTDEMKAAMKEAAAAEDGSQGGKMFKELLARAQQAPKRPPPPPPQPVQAAVPPPMPQAPPVMPAMPNPADYASMTVEQQAEMFRQMMAQQQQQQQPPPQAYAPPPPQAAFYPPPPAAQPAASESNYLPPGQSPDGRRYGRNRDADAIVNTSDVYFAQLKRDSTLRNMARYRGDEDFANKPFADPSIQEIKVHINPYLEEQKRQEQAMLETSPDEMILPEYFQDDGPNMDKSYTGVKYKDKLEERKKRMKQQQQQSQPIASASASAPAVEEKKEQTPPPAAAAAAPAAPAATTSQSPPKPQAVTPPPSAPAAATPSTVSTTTGESQTATPKSTSSTTTTKKSPEELRRDIRTLQGLLLKHRGGEGFGAGRIQGAEIERFEALANELIPILKEEAMTATAATTTPVTNDLTPPVPPTAATTTTPSTTTTTDSSSSSNKPVSERINGMISCIEGATVMYKNSPAELRDSVMVTLRAAMISAIETLNEVPGLGRVEIPSLSSSQSSSPAGAMGGGVGGGGGAIARAPTTPSADRVNGMISVLDGAIQMYKNSPPELQQAVLVTLRASLLSGVGTLSQIIDDNEQIANDAYRTVISDPRTRTSSEAAAAAKSANFQDVVPEKEVASAQPAPPPPAAATASSHDGTDENSVFFREVYQKLAQAKGDGKMGLRPDMNPEEASDLADDIAKMRSLLVQELDSGIPESSTSSDVGSSSSSSSSTSKYQEMLAKARAEKESKEP